MVKKKIVKEEGSNCKTISKTKKSLTFDSLSLSLSLCVSLSLSPSPPPQVAGKAKYMILANTIKKLWDLGGWHLAVTTQILMRTVDHIILEKCQNLRMNIQVLNQKLEPLMQVVVSNEMAAQEKAVPAGFNYMWFQIGH